MKRNMPSHEYIDEISIKTAKLELELTEFANNIKKKDDWLAWLGLFVTMVTTLLLSDFKPILSIDADTIKSVYLFCVCVVLFMTIKSFITGIKISNKNTVKYLLDVLVSKSQTPNEMRLIYIVKRGITENAKLLVFKDPIWDCYMFPHCKNDSFPSEKEYRTKLAEYLGVSSDIIKIDFYDSSLDKLSQKHSEYHHKTTNYYFKFCYASIVNAPNVILQDVFTIEGREFRWLSCQALEKDDGTRIKNGDVVRHISDNSYAFLNRKDSC